MKQNIKKDEMWCFRRKKRAKTTQNNDDFYDREATSGINSVCPSDAFNVTVRGEPSSIRIPKR